MNDTPDRPKSMREARMVAAYTSRLGSVLSERYELLDLLGYGGMGAVYLARHLLLERLVAVKFLLSEVAEDPVMRNRFLREATASGKINHPNVVQLIDYGEGKENEAYIVIEFLDGIGLDKLLRTERQLEYDRAVHIFEQICSGVAAAHARGIIHRDLKPSNVMLVEEDGDPEFVKVVDFGLAKALDPGEESQRLTQSGEVFGSPIYMAPEQCLGRQLDQRSDIYAMGALMYEVLMGKVPIVGANVTETIARQLQDLPRTFAQMRPDLRIPGALEAVVLKALEKDPDRRQPNMLVLREELLDSISTGEQKQSLKAEIASLPEQPPEHASPAKKARTKKLITRSREAEPPPATPPATPHRLLVYCLGGFSVLLFAAGIFSLVNASHSSENSKSAVAAPPMRQGRELPNPPLKPEKIRTETVVNNLETGAHNASTAGSKAVSTVRKPEIVPEIGSAHKPTVRKPEHALAHKEPVHEPTGLKKKTESRLPGSQKEEGSKIHKTHPHVAPVHEADSGGSESSGAEPAHKRHRDWHDFSNQYEKKEDYSHSWSVPLAGSKRTP